VIDVLTELEVSFERERGRILVEPHEGFGTGMLFHAIRARSS
jgi:hypothetical protein